MEKGIKEAVTERDRLERVLEARRGIRHAREKRHEWEEMKKRHPEAVAAAEKEAGRETYTAMMKRLEKESVEYIKANKSTMQEIQRLRIEAATDGLNKTLELLELQMNAELAATEGTEKDKELIRQKYRALTAVAEDKFADEQAKKRLRKEQKKLRGMRGLYSALMGGLPEKERRRMEAERWKEETKTALGADLAKKWGATIEQEAARRTKVAGRGAGQWEGFANLYRRLQTAAVSPEIKIAKDQLQKLIEMAKDIAIMREKIDKQAAVAA